MGEWSKRIGDEGESVVESLLDLMGWTEPQRNFDIPCLKPGEHSSKGNRKTHGVDRFFSYRTPLANRRLIHTVISVKSSTKPYPERINTLKSTFKEHFADLGQTVDCFHRSDSRAKANKLIGGVDEAEDIGVLFWLSMIASNELVPSILPDISSFTPDSETNFNTIHVVDNHQASFLFDTISTVRRLAGETTPHFFYVNTGQNYDQSTRTSSGSILPVEYITSPVILMMVESSPNEKDLIVSTRDSFSQDRLRRLLGLAKDITQNLHARTVILFPEFNELAQGNSVREVKAAFSERSFVQNASVSAYRGDFRSIPNA